MQRQHRSSALHSESSSSQLLVELVSGSQAITALPEPALPPPPAVLPPLPPVPPLPEAPELPADEPPVPPVPPGTSVSLPSPHATASMETPNNTAPQVRPATIDRPPL